MFIRKRLAGSLGLVLYGGLAVIPGFVLLWFGGGLEGILPASITNALKSLGVYWLLAFGASLLISPWIVLEINATDGVFTKSYYVLGLCVYRHAWYATKCIVLHGQWSFESDKINTTIESEIEDGGRHVLVNCLETGLFNVRAPEGTKRIQI